MFNSKIYKARRDKLRRSMNGKYMLFLGHLEVPKNYTDNCYDYRQNSSFLYFAGLQIPGMALLMTPKEDILFGYKPSVDDIIWTGPLPTLEELGLQVGIENVKPISELPGELAVIKSKNVKLHYLPLYQGENILDFCKILNETPENIKKGSSSQLIEAVVNLRNYKSDDEIKEMEFALSVSSDMYVAAAKALKPGKKEWQVKAAMVGAALSRHCTMSFHPIVTIHGEVLHNHSWENTISENGLFLLDSGAETPMGYASDITRTFPISGKFTPKERDIYQIVYDANEKAISMSAPGVSFKDMHLEAALVIAKGLTDLGLMKGNPQDAVENGAHALFYPHGLGHMIGLDVHDMEDLGDVVGYGPQLKRSSQFGLAFLRMARKLEPGFAFTVEPGIYFIGALMDKWKREGINNEFINFDKVNEYRSFGGIRLEDDILVTDDGYRLLGDPIPKSIKEVETLLEK
jgi:Xaa-Pro aminopeptidase